MTHIFFVPSDACGLVVCVCLFFVCVSAIYLWWLCPPGLSSLLCPAPHCDCSWIYRTFTPSTIDYVWVGLSRGIVEDRGCHGVAPLWQKRLILLAC